MRSKEGPSARGVRGFERLLQLGAELGLAGRDVHVGDFSRFRRVFPCSRGGLLWLRSDGGIEWARVLCLFDHDLLEMKEEALGYAERRYGEEGPRDAKKVFATEKRENHEDGVHLCRIAHDLRVEEVRLDLVDDDDPGPPGSRPSLGCACGSASAS